MKKEFYIGIIYCVITGGIGFLASKHAYHQGVLAGIDYSGHVDLRSLANIGKVNDEERAILNRFFENKSKIVKEELGD